MNSLELASVSKSFGDFTAVSNIDLTIPQGELVSFLGPSGCGKTTLLRLVAGLERATAGSIRICGEDVTKTPPYRRGIGMVFQSLALFPHLSVVENVAYGLRLAGEDRETCSSRANELLDLVRLPGLGDRAISQLSGGQRQRVAIARALALNPRLFLLDEPLSALDAKLREEMQVELKLLQQRLGVTTIVVTHDQREAMTMSDRIVVMSASRIQQVGAPLDIYRRPANEFVADFIGTANRIPATIAGKTAIEVLRCVVAIDDCRGLTTGDAATLMVRPEDLVLSRERSENGLDATVTFVRDLGAEVELRLRAGNQDLVATMAPKHNPGLAVGDSVSVVFPSWACWVMKAQ